jgi:hypothetical protein
MPSREINNILLDALLKDVLLAYNNYWTEAVYYFTDLYNTGMRSKEPLSIDRWSYTTDKYYLKTFKTEEVRTFESTELSLSLKEGITNKKNPYGQLTYDQLTLEFRKVLKLHPIYCGDKVVDTYLFRYNRARQLMTEWQDLSKVMNYFQWKNPMIAMNYITAPLVYDPFR